MKQTYCPPYTAHGQIFSKRIIRIFNKKTMKIRRTDFYYVGYVTDRHIVLTLSFHITDSFFQILIFTLTFSKVTKYIQLVSICQLYFLAPFFFIHVRSRFPNSFKQLIIINGL